MQYTVLFDVIDSGYRQWWFPAMGLIAIAIGTGLVIFRRRTERIFPFFFLGFAVLWTTFSFLASFADYRNLASDLHHGRCTVVEGVVTDLHPMPPGPPAGYKADWFTVGGEPFKLSRYSVTAGFNQMQSQGGPLREGMHVRISHSHGEIARLEIARP